MGVHGAYTLGFHFGLSLHLILADPYGLQEAEPYYGSEDIWGDAVLPWGPVVSFAIYSTRVLQWSRGDFYLSSDPSRDDVGRLLQALGGRRDEAGDTPATAAEVTPTGPASFSASGVVGSRTDLDYFRLVSTSNGTLQIDAFVLEDVSRADPPLASSLDVRLRLYDSQGVLLAESAPDDRLNAELSVNVQAGVYYAEVSGSGHGPNRAVGYTDYGSLGQYVLAGSLPPPAPCVTAATCVDDGIFCNGAVGCVEGLCVSNVALPCGAEEVCIEAEQRCEARKDDEGESTRPSCPANDRYEANGLVVSAFEFGTQTNVTVDDAIICRHDTDYYEFILCPDATLTISVTPSVIEDAFLYEMSYLPSLVVKFLAEADTGAENATVLQHTNRRDKPVFMLLAIFEPFGFLPDEGVEYTFTATVDGDASCDTSTFASFPLSTSSPLFPSTSPSSESTTTLTTTATTEEVVTTTTQKPGCVRKQNNCRRCRNDACVTCGSEWFLFEGRCVEACPEGFVGVGLESPRGRECEPAE